jgi:hypothetical protein
MALAVLIACPSANAGLSRPVAIKFINRAADVPGLWDETIRAEFVEAMNVVAANVSKNWLGRRSVVINSDVRSNWRLIVVIIR